MNGTIAYLDSSAVVKILSREPESRALRGFLAKWPDRVSSRLTRTETVRALLRRALPRAAEAVDALRGLVLVNVDAALLHAAGELDPPHLRTLDAVHLATALTFGDELGVFLSYDPTLHAAAVAAGLPAAAPT